MSLHPQAFCPVPRETVRVAHAAYPKGNVSMRVRDELEVMYDDSSFARCFLIADSQQKHLGVCCSSA